MPSSLGIRVLCSYPVFMPPAYCYVARYEAFVEVKCVGVFSVCRDALWLFCWSKCHSGCMSIRAFVQGVSRVFYYPLNVQWFGFSLVTELSFD
jgi:hypothetical protein